MTDTAELTVTGSPVGHIYPRRGDYNRIEEVLLTCTNCEAKPNDVLWPVDSRKKSPVRLHKFQRYGTKTYLTTDSGGKPLSINMAVAFYKCAICNHERQWG